jgi:hypothetical protein
MNKYTYTKDAIVNLDQITNKIKQDSIITTELVHINFTRPDLSIIFSSALSTPEKDELDTIVNGFSVSSLGKENYHVQTYSNTTLQKDEWYETDNGDGTYSGKCREIEYDYKGKKIVKYFERIYLLNGDLVTEEEFRYYTQNDGNIVVLKKI